MVMQKLIMIITLAKMLDMTMIMNGIGPNQSLEEMPSQQNLLRILLV